MRRIPLRAPLLCAAALLILRPAGPAAGDSVNDDGVPSQMVSFFMNGSAACPPEWDTAVPAAGRLIVAVDQPAAVGVQVGAPLADQEDRVHQHSYTATLTLPYKSIAAADGGNHQGAAAGAVPLSGTTAPAPSGLPFIQLPVCVRR